MLFFTTKVLAVHVEACNLLNVLSTVAVLITSNMAVRRGKDGRSARLGSVINPYQAGRNFANAAGRRLYVGNLAFEVTWQGE